MTTIRTALTRVTADDWSDHAVAPMIIPPDGGWGWVVVLVGLLSAASVDGCSYCFYLYREPMSEELHIPESDISFLSGLANGFYFFGSVFACSFANQWGFRMTMMIGATVTSLTYAAGSVLHKIVFYYIIVGVLGGMGSGFVSAAASLPPGYYFDKKRPIVFGIVYCGSGFGGMVFPYLTQVVLEHFGWRNAYLFEGGVTAFSILLGTLIRPLRPVMVVFDVDSLNLTLRPAEESFMDTFRMATSISQAQDPLRSFFSLQHSAAAEAMTSAMPSVMMTSAHPTIAQMADNMTLIGGSTTSKVTIRVITDNPNAVSRLDRVSQYRRTQQSAGAIGNIQITQELLTKRKIPWYKCGCCRSKYVTFPERPLMRDDLCYTGHISRLPEYTNTARDIEYHMRVTRMPDYYQRIQDLTKNYTAWCCHNICVGLKHVVDYTMFKSLTFNCLALCGFACYLAFYVPFVFCKVHLDDLGAGNVASLMVTVINFGNMLGRLTSGLFLAAFPKLGARSVTSATIFVSAVAITCVVFYNNLYYKALCFFIYGFAIGFFPPLRGVLIVDYFGLEKLTSGSGVLLLCLGFGSTVGPTLADTAMQYTKSTNAPFYFCGGSLLLSSIALIPMEMLSKWEKKRKGKKELTNKREMTRKNVD